MTLEDYAVEAMREGVDARRAGQPQNSCPHRDGTREGNQWRQGWRGQDRHIRNQEIEA